MVYNSNKYNRVPLGAAVDNTETSTDTNPSNDKSNFGTKVAEFLTPDNAMTAAIDVVSGGFGGKGINRFLTKTKLGKKLLNKIPGLSKILEKTPKRNKDFDFSSNPYDKYNVNIKRYGSGDPALYPKIDEGSQVANLRKLDEVITHSTQGVNRTGKSLEKAGYKVQDLSVDNVKKIGVNDSGQEIYEVTYPNGETLRFWQSTGKGSKGVKFSKNYSHLDDSTPGASKGYFGVLPGNVDASSIIRPGTNKKMSDSWFIKADGWERGYGSEIIEDTGIWLKSLKESGKI